MKKRSAELTKRLDNLIQMRADGEITSEQLKQMQSSTKSELHTLIHKILYIENVNKNWFIIRKEQFDFLLKSSELFQKGDKKEKI